MIKYAHVGLPKCASTWMQFEFFSKHPELFHLGRERGDVIVSNEMRLFLKSYVLDMPHYLYSDNKNHAMFEKYFALAKKEKDISAVGISQEVLTNAFQGKVDLHQRAKRLTGAMGEDTKIILFVREQLDFLQSIYATYVKEGGLDRNFEEWLTFLCYERDISAFSGLLFDKIYSSYVECFSKENVLLIPFEHFRSDTVGVMGKICDFIGVNYLQTMSFAKRHARPSIKVLGAMLALNKKWKFALGDSCFKRKAGHRLEPWYTDVCGIEVPDYVQEDKKRHQFMYSAEQSVVDRAQLEIGNFPPLSLEYPPEIKKMLVKVIAPHNRELSLKSGLDLKSLGYIC